MSEVYTLERIAPPDAAASDRDDSADLHFVPAPCQVACPIGTDAPSYIGHIWEGEWRQAFEAITATNPFSSICGRVCDAPCEPACRRTSSDGPLMIRNLKRYVMDRVGHDFDPPAVPVTREESVAVVGGGPAGLTAAHELAVAGFRVHVYELTDRLGGMMVWGIPAFRLPPGIMQEDLDRLRRRCPGVDVHLGCGLGEGVTLDQLKARHEAVLVTIGAWWGKPMGIPGEDDARVVDGVGFLRRVNGGDRPELPETVVVVGGGDVAMDACRVALRLPGCKRVKVVYRRGPGEIPARRIELEGAVAEGVELVYHTQQVAVRDRGDGLALECVRTELGEPDADGRRRPVPIAGSEHEIECGMVIAAVGQTAACAELARLGLMDADRVRANFDGMRTSDPKVFAAGDGAFGGSTIVMAMHHGQRAAHYVRSFLDGLETPLPYRTPYRTRRVPVAQDILWERNPPQEPEFHGLGDDPASFPEIESTYDDETARREAARCYRCDAETGSADYSVRAREDLFSMARTHPNDNAKHRAMLTRRRTLRADPFPEGRPATLDDLTFLPANLSRLVIDPYREACRVDTCIGRGLEVERPFFVTGFDEAPDAVRRGVATGLARARCGYVGRQPIADEVQWLQVLDPGAEPHPGARGVLYVAPAPFEPFEPVTAREAQLVGLVVSDPAGVEAAIRFGLERRLDALLLDGSGGLGALGGEARGAPDLTLLRDAVRVLRVLRREEAIDLIHYGGVRSGTDVAKLIGLGAKASVLGVVAALAAGGALGLDTIEFDADRTHDERAEGIVNILAASANEASMMARCTGKTNLQNIEPEDLRSITLATAEATGILLAGSR